MKAYELKEAGSVDQLQIIEIDKPIASVNEVVIKSKAISINPVDIKTRMGKSLYKAVETKLLANNYWLGCIRYCRIGRRKCKRV
jgi:NADPH:quinone reductase-like Zn-dependent oxidoreductase